VEGNAVGTPARKGQCLILQHAGGEQGWKGLKLADYHDNIDHATFIQWLKEKSCHALLSP
jgi:hypothetical protein